MVSCSEAAKTSLSLDYQHQDVHGESRTCCHHRFHLPTAIFEQMNYVFCKICQRNNSKKLSKKIFSISLQVLQAQFNARLSHVGLLIDLITIFILFILVVTRNTPYFAAKA